MLILNINSETSEEHKYHIHEPSWKLIQNFVLIEKTTIVNKLKQSKDLQQLVAQKVKEVIVYLFPKFVSLNIFLIIYFFTGIKDF